MDAEELIGYYDRTRRGLTAKSIMILNLLQSPNLMELVLSWVYENGLV